MGKIKTLTLSNETTVFSQMVYFFSLFSYLATAFYVTESGYLLMFLKEH